MGSKKFANANFDKGTRALLRSKGSTVRALSAPVNLGFPTAKQGLDC